MTKLTFAAFCTALVLLPLLRAQAQAPSSISPTFNQEKAYSSLRLVKQQVGGGLFTIGVAAGLAGGIHTFAGILFMDATRAMVNGVAIQTAGLVVGGVGYYLMSTSSAQAATLATPYMQSPDSIKKFLELPEDKQILIMNSDSRLVEMIDSLAFQIAAAGQQVEKR